MITQDRQVERTEAAIREAFLDLIREQGYDSITVKEIIDRANIGRSTFYRHYADKLDLLVNLHGTILDALDLSTYLTEGWSQEVPPSSLLTFYEGIQRYVSSPQIMLRTTKDLPLIMLRINDLLLSKVEASLQAYYMDADLTLPIPVLAQAIASVYNGMMALASTKQAYYPPDQMAAYTHQVIRSIMGQAVQG